MLSADVRAGKAGCRTNRRRCMHPPLATAAPSASARPLVPCQIADFIGAGKVKLEVAQSLPLEQAAKAHDQVATGHTRGKVVLTV